MSLDTNEIAWAAPVLPAVADEEWAAEVTRTVGGVGDVDLRVAPSPWLRTAVLRLKAYRVSQMPTSLVDMAMLVTAQENACRYCYGATRAVMRTMGYSRRRLAMIERETQLAELEPRERAFARFCRNLARSNPRPVKDELESLIALGYRPLAVKEMAFLIAMTCFFNRVTTLIACPPELEFEHYAERLPVRLKGLARSLFLRTMVHRSRTAPSPPAAADSLPEDAPFRPLLEALDGLPATDLLREMLDSALASPVLPRRTKLLMFAVVARALDCGYCGEESQRLLAEEGFGPQDVDACVAALGSPDLEPWESSILGWVRDTVHYQPVTVQERTRTLGGEIGDAELLEAVGVAALANGTVRLAMLLQ